jgi:predicted DNA-binding transcriptional regulator AlpA
MKKNDILNRIESSAYLGISLRTVYNLIARGELQQMPDGRFLKKELDRYLKIRKRRDNGLRAFVELQLKQTRIQKENILLQLLTKETVPSDDVCVAWVERMHELKTSLMSWPNVLPLLLEGKNEQEMRDILKKEVEFVMSRYSRPGRWTPKEITS